MSSHSVNPSILSNLKLVKSLKTFSKRRQEILLAFLFGSSTRDCLRPSSDVDIGVLFKTVPERDALNDLTGQLSSILKREIDLVVLNHTSPVLKMQILKNGILIYSSSNKYFHQFFADTVNQYDDLKRIRKYCEENILKGRIYA